MLHLNNFHNTLNNPEISGKSYKHVLNVCKSFNMSAMNDYHDLCLKVDVLLLACVFQNFGKDSINSFPSSVSS